MTTHTDIQGFRPDAGAARQSLGSVAQAWPAAASGLTSAISMANVKPSGYVAKRHDATFTGRPSEVST